jgi:hypothetical protein
MLRNRTTTGPLKNSSFHWLNVEQLPYVTSAVERFLPDLRGRADGMILANGVEVCLAPYLSAEILSSVQPRDRVTVYGGLVWAMTVMSAVVIETMDGRLIVDDGSPEAAGNGNQHEAQPPRGKLEVEALLRRALHGPTGEIRGGLLDDGTVARFPSGELGFAAGLLRRASRLVVRGEGIVTGLGTVIEVAEIGPSKDSLRPVSPWRGN